MSIIVYTLPDCPNCETLKEWLKMKGIDYIVAPFDTLNQSRFIMENIFGSTPILETPDGLILVGEDMFVEHELIEGPIEVIIG